MQDNGRNKFKGLRRLNALGLALIMLMSMLPGTGLAQEYPYETQAAQGVNMRRSPSGSSVVLERIKAGDSVIVLGESGDYYQITFNERTGYAMKKYIDGKAPASSAPQPASSASLQGTVTGYPYQTTTNDTVNMRKSPSTSAKLIQRIPKNAVITVLERDSGFLKVFYKDEEGYVAAGYVNELAFTTPVPTAAPMSTPGLSSSYIALQSGSTGAEVRALQQAMIELGFLSGTADGIFGSGTQSAVKAFQAMNGHPQTGVADGNLQALLYDGKPKNAKGTKTEVMTLAPIAGVTMRLNNTGDAVSVLQTRLRELGYLTATASGVYDKETMAAVKAFQKKNGLTADGLAGTNTYAALYSPTALGPTAEGTYQPAPSPTPMPTFNIPAVAVKYGSSGEEARAVQQRLKDLGYLAGAADGKFGVDSVNALKAFQYNHGLKQDGIAGTGTYAVLFSLDALNASQTPTPAPTAVATTPLTQGNTILITLGSQGEAVLRLQKRLTDLGYYTARMDGEYLSSDMAAVQDFQKNNGLKVDGKAGYATQSKLYSDSAVTAEGAPEKALTTLRQGDRNNDVKEMQEKLISLGYLAAGEADGRYGSKTAQAVVAFQRANGLVRDGVAGKKTLTLLYGSGGTAAPTAVPAPTATPAPANGNATVRKGDINDAVKELQTRLIDLGYLGGRADGNFGVQTYMALVAFQKRNGLTADGIAGAKTWQMIASNSAKGPAGATAAPTATPSGGGTGGLASVPKASQVRYANWYSEIRALARKYPYATVYDFSTGISWQVHMFSLGAHADSEPVTAQDTANMIKAFGGKNTWTPKAVWVVFADGSVYLASTHDYPHDVQHNTANNFAGHVCIHFPRTQSQVESIGVYATSHQKAIDKGWIATQNMMN